MFLQPAWTMLDERGLKTLPCLDKVLIALRLPWSSRSVCFKTCSHPGLGSWMLARDNWIYVSLLIFALY